MNANSKIRWANILTAIASIIAIVQTFLTTPPFSTETVFTIGAVLTYVSLLATTWKQYLSPEVASTGTKVTIAIAIAATLAGLLDLLNVTHFSDQTEQYVRWGITVASAILNILSKQIFPSSEQKETMREAKFK